MLPFEGRACVTPEGQGWACRGRRLRRPPGSRPFRLTIVQCPRQDGRVAGAAVPDACEGQHLDLIEHVFAQARELGAAGCVSFHQPDAGLGVRVLLLVPHLPGPSAGEGRGLHPPCQRLSCTCSLGARGRGDGTGSSSEWLGPGGWAHGELQS